MKPEQMKELVEKLGFTQLGAAACGLANGFPIFMPAISVFGKTVMMVKTDRIPYGDERKKLNARLKPYGGEITNFKDGGPGLPVEFPFGKNAPLQPADFILTATSILADSGYKPEDRCLICGGTGCDAASVHGNTFGTVHHSCLDIGVIEAQDAHDEDEMNSKILPGIIGALLGAAVGTLPTLLTIILLNGKILMALFTLLPICAYYGYKLLGGRMKGSIPFIASVVSAVLGVFLLIIEGQAAYYLKDAGYSFSKTMKLMKRLIGKAAFWSEAVSNNTTAFIFVALGILFSRKLISQTADKTLKNAKGHSALAYRFPQTTAKAEYYSPSEAGAFRNENGTRK